MANAGGLGVRGRRAGQNTKKDKKFLGDSAMSGGLSFYEFFAGGGMARLGLGSKWTCLASNEICEKKARTYRANFGSPDKLILKDVNLAAPADLPGRASLAWASFPCQDLSLAGNR